MPAVTVTEKPPWRSLRRSSGGDDYLAIQAAVNDLGSRGGGFLFLGPGTWRTSQSITFPSGVSSGVSICGAGMRATTLERTADVFTLDMGGSGESTFNGGHGLRDINVSGGGIGTVAAVRMFYGALYEFNRTRFTNSPVETIVAVQLWDSYFYKCRFERGGSADGTKPNAVFACRTSDTPGAMGYSTDSSNQLTFIDPVIESSPGGIWFERNYGGASGATNNNHTIKIEHLHAESVSQAGPMVRARGSYNICVQDSMFYGHTLGAGASAQNHMDFGASGNSASQVTLRGISFHGDRNAGVTRTLATFGACAGLHLDRVHGSYVSGKAPSVAMLEFTGSANTDVSIRNTLWMNNPDSAALFSGAPTSLAQSSLTPVFSGVGKTTVSDADFGTGAAINGGQAIARNTTDGKTYLGMRVNGSWRHVEMT